MNIALMQGAARGCSAQCRACGAAVSVLAAWASMLEAGLEAGLYAASLESTWSRRVTRANNSLGFRRLSRICTEQPIFERRPVEPADDRVHLLGVRRFDERETLGLLCFRIADDFDCVGDKVFGA